MNGPDSDDARNSPSPVRYLRRRRFVAAGASVATALFAGCTASDDGVEEDETTAEDSDDSSGNDSNDASAGSFRLLISDDPVAIDEFDSLEVSFDDARVFSNGDDREEDEGEDGRSESEQGDDESGGDDGEDETDDEGQEANAEDGGDEESVNGDDDAGGQGGFEVIPLDGATVDLTRVVGDKAISVFDGRLDEGAYTKVELRASGVEGIVDGDVVEVKIPSEKLQIKKPFEVRAGETVSFVFDINVVKKGNGGYNLLPVIGESGVAGEDVDVEEIDDDGDRDDDDSQTHGEDDSEDSEAQGEDDSEEADEEPEDEEDADEQGGE